MRVHANRDSALVLAAQASKAVPKITTIPELKGIHMEADARLAMLTMTATNQEVSIRASMPAAVEESGSAVIPADLLPDILKRLPGDQISFSTVGPGIIHIGSGYAEYRLNILDAAKYPLPEVPFLEDTIPVSGICSLARQTLFAAAAGDQQNILKTVRLKVGPYWYMEQDDLTLGAKNAQFLKLFHAEDQGVVEDWISRCHAEEPYTAPRRDRKSALLYAVLERARACGDLREIEPILDYYLPTEQEPMASDLDSYLTNYQFSAVANISYGCEGIFVDLVIEGDFDDSGANRCVIGTFKTLRQDSDAGRLMGQLCGVLMYHTTRYVNENLHRYTPKRELEAELRRKQACGGQKEGKT